VAFGRDGDNEVDDAVKTEIDTLTDCIKSRNTSPDWAGTIARGVAAANTLGQLKDVRSFEILVKALGFSHHHVAAAAAAALGHLGDLRAIAPLATAAEKVDLLYVPYKEKLREDFIGPLRELKALFPVETITTLAASHSPPARLMAAEMADQETAPAILSALKMLLKDSVPRVRQKACESLSKSADAVDDLIAALTDPDRLVRHKAATALGELKDPRALEPLAAAIDQCPEAFLAILSIGGERAIIQAIAALKASEQRLAYHYKARAVYFLGKSNDPRSVVALIDRLDQETGRYGDNDIRRALMFTLAKFCDARALPALIRCHGHWFEHEHYSLRDVIGVIVSAHVATLTNEMLNSLAQLKDIDFRRRYEDGSATDELISFEPIRSLAHNELLLRKDD